VDLSGRYCVDKIRTIREGHIRRIHEGVEATIRLAIGNLAETVALFVRDRFFDKMVVPALLSFRNKGGRISDLESELSRQIAAFEPELLEHLRTNQIVFQQSIRSGVLLLVGRELLKTPSLPKGTSLGSTSIGRSVPSSVATNVGDAIGVTVTAAITTAVATISGGIGHSLGLALVSGILGVSGPVGLLIGGVAALVLVGGSYRFGRDRVTAAVKHLHIPAPVVAMALRDAKLKQARDSTYSKAKQEIQDLLEPQVNQTIEVVLGQLSLAVVASRPQDPS
jgi:hypothetical protein